MTNHHARRTPARRALRGVVIAAMTLLMAVAAVACGRHHNDRNLSPEAMERRALDRVGWVLDDIDATDAQKAKIEPLVKALVPKAAALRDKHRPTHEALAREVISGKADAGKVHGVVTQTAGDWRRFAHEVADAALSAHGVLDAGQRAKLGQMADDHHRGGDWSDRKWLVNAMVDRGLDKLDATDAQTELVYDHKERLEAEMPRLQARRDKTRQALRDQLLSDKPDAKVVHATIDEAVSDFEGMAHKVADAALDLSRTLSPAQRTLIGEKLAEHMK